jgi:hypothetical protein
MSRPPILIQIDHEKFSSLLNRMPEAESLDVLDSVPNYGLRDRLALRPGLKARLKPQSP